jgi:hypothetical protein
MSQRSAHGDDERKGAASSVEQLVQADLTALINKCLETVPGQTPESIVQSVQATTAALEVLENYLKPPRNR